MNNVFQNKKIVIASICFVVIVIITAVVLLLTQQDTSNTIDTVIIDTSLQTEAQKQIVIFQELIQKNPQDAETQRGLGRMYYLVGDFANAQTYINQAIQLDTTNPQYFVDLGLLYEAQHKYKEAEQAYQNAIILNTQVHEDSTVQNAAEEQKVFLRQTHPPIVYNLPTPYRALADFYIKQNNLQKAIRVLQDGILVIPEYPDFYLMLAQTYTTLGDSQNSETYQRLFDEHTK